MSKINAKFHLLLHEIIKNGYRYTDKSRAVFCKQISTHSLEHNLKTDGFPAISTKQLYWKGVVGELLWFLRGETNIKYLVDKGINIWNKDAYNWYMKAFKEQYPNSLQNAFTRQEFVEMIKDGKMDQLRGFKLGDLGPVYGSQWRDFNGNDRDQFVKLIDGLRENPMNRRNIVTAWNPTELHRMALPPCHWAFEIIPRPLLPVERQTIYRDNHKILWDNVPNYAFDLKWHQRSVDTFLGLPFNIASYGLLAHIIGKLTNMVPENLIGDLSNVHIYEPHLDAVKEQLSRNPLRHNACELDIKGSILNKGYREISSLKTQDVLDILHIDDFKLSGYAPDPTIKADMLAPNT